MIIALASYPGSDIEKVSKLLALQLGIKYISKEKILSRLHKKEEEINASDMEKIENLIKEESKRSHLIVDWMPAIWSCKADVKFFIYKSLKKRALKRARELKKPISEAKNMLEDELEKNKKVLLELGLQSVDDARNYDLIINGDKIDGEGITSVIIKYIKNIKVE